MDSGAFMAAGTGETRTRLASIALVVLLAVACGRSPARAGGRDTARGPDAGGTIDGSVDPRKRDGSVVGFDTNVAALPACHITAPIIGPSHVALNGVPAAQGGDRATADGTPYAVAFEVTTSVPNDQTVELAVSDAATPPTVVIYTAMVTKGKARFPAVPLQTGATYRVAARCLDRDGEVGASDTEEYPVDTTAPDLVVVHPSPGEAIPPSGLTDGAFPVCGHTGSADAVNLPAALGARAANFCADVSGRPNCAAAAATGSDVCVNLPCPGDGAFDVEVTLTDAAGNLQQEIVSGVSCFSTLPMIHIVTPDSDVSPFTDISKRLLASSASQGLRDQAAGTPGAQTNVVACSSRAGTITLFAGLADASLTAVGAGLTTRVAVAADACPSGSSFAVTFPSVTLPESSEDAETKLVAPTELRADIVDVSSAKNSSPIVHLWVDSIAPVLSLTAPADLCGSTHQSAGTFETAETVTSTAPIVELILTTNDFTETFSSATFTNTTFPSVVFVPGETHLAGTARDAAGNTSDLQPAPCVVTVGAAPH
jgi:hypothetical protein